jgi:integrase
LVIELLDDAGQPIPEVSTFLRFLRLRDYSPNTTAAYAYDLQHFYRFLTQTGLTLDTFKPPQALTFLNYLRSITTRRHSQRRQLVRVALDQDAPATYLAATTINRILAAVSSFYEYLIVTGQFVAGENPIQQQPDPAQHFVSDRHRPFLGHAVPQRPVRRLVRVKTVEHVPRPLPPEQVQQLLGSFRRLRDQAMVLLMLHGGLRPGEVLNLHLKDIEYGRRRVIIRYRTDHPAGVRTKSRTERIVDLHEVETLRVLSAYILHERPADAQTPFVFLVGGRGQRRHQPLSYHALVKLFQRHCAHLQIRDPYVTPHALRHTHATAMWEGGMRELTLQKRLGHASPESTRLYTRVSDPIVVAEYNRALGKEPSA